MCTEACDIRGALPRVRVTVLTRAMQVAAGGMGRTARCSGLVTNTHSYGVSLRPFQVQSPEVLLYQLRMQ